MPRCELQRRLPGDCSASYRVGRSAILPRARPTLHMAKVWLHTPGCETEMMKFLQPNFHILQVWLRSPLVQNAQQLTYAETQRSRDAAGSQSPRGYTKTQRGPKQ